MTPKIIIIIGSVAMAIAVGAGAFGAHALKTVLSAERLETWQTAVQYQAWHALALLLVGVIASHFELNLNIPAYLFLAGILIFSGSLYLLCLTNTSWLGAITPIGGVAFIAGWIVLAVKVFNSDF